VTSFNFKPSKSFSFSFKAFFSFFQFLSQKPFANLKLNFILSHNLTLQIICERRQTNTCAISLNFWLIFLLFSLSQLFLLRTYSIQYKWINVSCVKPSSWQIEFGSERIENARKKFIFWVWSKISSAFSFSMR
jgi:hypothetical protein